ncbi:unnamed protein product [Clonostachys byssicola]|uniref:Putative peptidase domain-containing protein n=1 Tax=Clonostachys byssicola TaxID=160290 RepID=A0A9N9U399_9HYPO|nr:unnamed protein product [Clonostachys byssicola]
MKVLAASALLSLLSSVSGSPVDIRAEKTTSVLSAPQTTQTSSSVYDWSAKWESKFHIHQSCNSTLRAQLETALDETVQLAQHARDHLLAFGNSSDLVVKYFGNGSTAGPIGWYDRVVAANKEGVIFRCDDPDKNCATQNGWAGHWRGSNATSETVICDLSFQIRRRLNSMCGLGYTVAGSKLNTFWATDLLHRVFHVPAISEGIVDHYIEGYNDALQQAKEKPELSQHDSNVLQYFAVDAWAYDIAAPGVGCTGKAAESSSSHSSPTSTQSSAPSATSDSPKECHTHSDGVVHCS